MSGSSPDPRYYKDPHGLRPRWRLFFHAPGWYCWLMMPMWLLRIWLRWKDRNHPTPAKNDSGPS
jgi:hypothetical protein